MGSFTYGLIGVYALLTDLAGLVHLKQKGFQVQSFFFVVVSSGIIGMLFISSKSFLIHSKISIKIKS